MHEGCGLTSILFTKCYGNKVNEDATTDMQYAKAR
jgi:hypothetical protein